MHGGSRSKHWIGSSSIYPSPTIIDTAYKLPDTVVRNSLLELHLHPDINKSEGLRVDSIKVYLQPDGWSCGYRTCAYLYRMTMGDTPEALANIYFDSEELRGWLLNCLSLRAVSSPPQATDPPNAKRVFGSDYAPVQRIRILLPKAEWTPNRL
jgi:hypothetical protein